ncbi:MAG TPA: hypothetical protein VFK05_24650 [Polyangiaceae bacterium]|nr:hypothetical protein [Polyangiaceae bacterium]
MANEEDIVRVKRAAQDALLKLPGVVGVGVGPKISQSARTGELAIVVYVEKKLDLESIPVEHRIPSEIEGVKTDVVPAGRPVLAQDEPPEPRYIDQRRYRKGEHGLHGGIQLALEEPEVISHGTLGCIVTRSTPQGLLVFGLTNAHVANVLSLDNTSVSIKDQAEKTGGPVGQPTPGGSDCSGCCTDVIGKVAAARFDLLVDGAIIRLDAGLPWSAEIEGIGTVAGQRTLTTADLNTDVIVRKRGRTTLVTRGVVRSVDQAGNSADEGVVVRTYDHQVAVSPLPPFKAFIDRGDSGSVVVDNSRNIVSLNHTQIGSTKGGVLITGFGVSSPIAEVVSGFQVQIPTATTLGVVNTVPKIQAAGAAAGLDRERSMASIALDRARDQIGETAVGRHYLRVFRQHESEVRNLITRQPRVAATWRRRKGEALGSRLMSSVYQPQRQILDSASTAEGLLDILDMLERYGSPALQRDICDVRPKLKNWASLSYSQLLVDLRDAESSGVASELQGVR